MNYNKLSKAALIQLISEKHQVVGPIDVLNSIRKLIKHWDQEYFIVVMLNHDNAIIKSVVISIGARDEVIVDHSILWRRILTTPKVSAIIMAHNHPSGNLNPSKHDTVILDRIKKCGDLFGIDLLDSLIVTETEYLRYE